MADMHARELGNKYWALAADLIAYCVLRACTPHTPEPSRAPCRLRSALQKEDGSFCPAHALADGRMERAGRAGKADLARPSTGSTLTKSAGIVVVGDEILAAKVGILVQVDSG